MRHIPIPHPHLNRARRFPRTAAAASEGASPSILSLEQNSARDQFKVWAWVQGFSEQKNIPVLTKQSAQHAKQVTADSAGLVATPKAVLDAYRADDKAA